MAKEAVVVKVRGLDGSHSSSRYKLLVFGVAFAIIGTITLLRSFAAVPVSSIETESGTISGCATTISNSGASGGSAIKFGASSCGGVNVAPSADAGASLPISYDLGSLTGSIIYVATSGSDTSGNGTVGSPYATLSKAITSASSGSTIVVRGGTYRQGGLSVGKALTIIAFPGETPVFNGAVAVSGGWSTSGGYSYRAYTPIPVTTGSGITFSSCQNQTPTTNCTGQFADQVWVGTTQYDQVYTQAELASGKFWVDQTNDRLYMMTSDLGAGSVEISSQRTFASVTAANVTLRGFKVIRYSNNGSDYGVINFTATADNSLMQDIYQSDSAYIAVQYTPSGSDLNTHSTIKDSTIVYSNWMGVGANGTDYLTIDHSDLSNMNQFGEFTSSPQSGSLKTSRTDYTKVLNSKIKNNRTVGIWFDQSNYFTVVAGNDIEDNTGAGIFYEISDYLYAVNNYIKAGGRNGIEISASSNTYLLNNTIVAGQDQVGIYVDSRSIAGCSDPAQALCSGSYNSDRDNYRPHRATMTWFPGINVMANNIIAYPSSGSGYCGGSYNVCITQTNGSATVPIETIIHQADAGNGVPKTIINGNVYANGSGVLIATKAKGNFSTLNAFASAMAASPVSISGLEALGLAGNSYVNADGSPTASLTALHGSAYPVPTDSSYNAYLPAGTKHFGVTYK